MSRTTGTRNSTGRRTPRIAGTLLLLGATLLGACDGDRNVELPEVSMDSAGSKIERGVEKAGEKLDTAMSGLKNEFNEAQIRGTLGRMQGMDNVDVELREDGHVHLHGTVSSPRERQLAEDVTRNIKGVTGVTNGLAIGAPLTPPGDTSRKDPKDTMVLKERL